MTEKFKESLDFIVKYYRPNAFRTDDNLFCDVPVHQLPWWRRTAIAASIGIGILAASAFLYYNLKTVTNEQTVQEQVTLAPTEPEVIFENEVKRIEFKDETLQEVATAITDTYGVEVDGIGEAKEIRLTLSYEGTAEDLVATINDLLGTNLKIADLDSDTKE